MSRHQAQAKQLCKSHAPSGADCLRKSSQQKLTLFYCTSCNSNSPAISEAGGGGVGGGGGGGVLLASIRQCLQLAAVQKYCNLG